MTNISSQTKTASTRESFFDDDSLVSIELQQRLFDDDAGVRRIALIELADEEDEENLPLIVHATQDVDATVRAEAARLLASWESAVAVSALVNLLTDGDKDARGAAAQSLAELKTRTSILRALRELRFPQAVDAALASINHADTGVRREAVGILGWLKHEPALPLLATLAQTDVDAEVRHASVGALGMSHDENIVLPALLAALHDSEWLVREEAATTLGKLQLNAAAPALIAALTDSYWQVQLRATRALGRIGDKTALTPVIDMLQHSLSNVRKEAAIALGELGDTSAGAALTEAANDADPDVRKSARLALNKLGIVGPPA